MPAWLVVNADDLGVSKGANAGVLRAHREGIVTSASLCVTTPSYAHALETVVRACPDLGVGLHFSLTLGSPAAEQSKVPLLVGENGRFAWTFSSLMWAAGVRSRADLLAQIAVELDAQFARLEGHGITPDHVNGERHVHLIPGILELVVAAARKHGVKWIRAGHDRAGRYAIGVGGAKSVLLTQLGERARASIRGGLSTPRYVASYMYTGRVDAFLPTLLREASDGVTEVMVHPGIPEENGAIDFGYREIERYLNSADRRRELDACVAARGHTGSWQLTNYRKLSAARSATGVTIEKMSRAHVSDVERLHGSALTGLLADLGPAAVRAYYEAAAESPLASAFVAMDGDDLLGFVIGAVLPAALRDDIKRRNPFGIVFGTLVGAAGNPSVAQWLVRGSPAASAYDKQAPELVYLAVSPSARGKGVGRKLVDAFAGAMRSAGQTRYELSVEADNRDAIAFYEKLGMKKLSDYAEFGRQRVRYTAALGPT